MTSAPRPAGEELRDLLIALELKLASFYEALARRFDAQRDLRSLWSELAADERDHARLLHELSADCDVAVWPALAKVHAALDEIGRHLERLERGEISSGEALAITVNLETSETVELSNGIVAAVARRDLTFNTLQWTTVHVNRLIAAVDQLEDSELTTALKTLARKAAALDVGCRRTILVVDDEDDMLESCARIIRRCGHACMTTSSGQDALVLLDRERPDLVLTDLRMPGMDGLELLRRFKKIAPAVPVVVFTGYVSDGSARAVLEAGAASYLAKPFTASQLNQTVNRALGLQDGASRADL